MAYERRFNLNLLPILDALLDCHSVTRAGERLDLSQPAASAALAKLREAFGDELLVPVGREMKLTPKAERIREPVRQVLELLETTFQSPDEDPATWRGEFIMATADYVAMLLLPRLVKVTRAVTPRMTLRITNITRNSEAHLRNGDIDMIIAVPEIVSDRSLMSRQLFTDRFVVLHSKEHPPPSGDIEDYMARDHIATVIDAPHIEGAPRSNFSDELDSLRATQHNLAIVPYYSLLPLLIAGTPNGALVQERLARIFEKMVPVAYSNPPTEIPPLHLKMFWSPEYNDEPRHLWMRDTIYDVSGEFRGPGGRSHPV